MVSVFFFPPTCPKSYRHSGGISMRVHDDIRTDPRVTERHVLLRDDKTTNTWKTNKHPCYFWSFDLSFTFVLNYCHIFWSAVLLTLDQCWKNKKVFFLTCSLKPTDWSDHPVLQQTARQAAVVVHIAGESWMWTSGRAWHFHTHV